MNTPEEKNNMSVEDLANMMCASISTQMLITIEHDKVTVEGGTALDIFDMYIMCKALEVVGRRLLPMMENEDKLRECMKGLIDIMQFEDNEKEGEA